MSIDVTVVTCVLIFLCLLSTDDEVDEASVEKAAKLNFDTPMTTTVSAFYPDCQN